MTKTFLAMAAGALFSAAFSQPVYGPTLAVIAAVVLIFYHSM